STSGVTGTVDLAGTANNVAALGSFAVTGGDFLLTDNGNTGLLGINGPVSAATVRIGDTNTGTIAVNGSVTGTTGVTLAAGSGGIVLNAGDFVSGPTIDLSATGGGVTQDAGGTLLESTGGVTGTVDLAGTANNLASIGKFAVTSGNFLLSDNGNTGLLNVAGPVSAATIRIGDANTGTIAVNGSLTGTSGVTLAAGSGGIL